MVFLDRVLQTYSLFALDGKLFHFFEIVILVHYFASLVVVSSELHTIWKEASFATSFGCWLDVVSVVARKLCQQWPIVMAVVCCLGLIMNCSLWWDNIMISMNAIISVKWHWCAWNLAFLPSWWHRSTMLRFIHSSRSCITFQTIFRSMTPHSIQIYPTELWTTLWHLF